jgi:cytochrome c-type biogenesis protein CcmH
MPRHAGWLKVLGLLLALAASPLPVAAISADEPLGNPAEEARAHAISRTLRCLVCQNQSIEDSNAPLARDLRRVVRERISTGESDSEVRQYVVARYGDWVLLKPPFKPATYALWLGPFVLLGVACLGVAAYYRRLRRRAAAEAPAQPLSPEEQERLAALLGPGQGR